jgi:hypothetical protein
MNTRDFLRSDTLQFNLYAPEDPIAHGSDGIDPLLEAIRLHAGIYTPERISAKKAPRAYSQEAVKHVLEAQDPEEGISLYLSRRTDPKVTYKFEFMGEDAPIGFWLEIILPLSFFEDPRNAEERSRAFVSLASALAKACNPVYGYAHSRADTLLGTDPHTRDPFAPFQVYEMYWLNIYGPPMVEQLGRDRVRSTPSFRLEELPDGGVLLLTRPTPIDFASNEARVAQASALTWLRPEVNFEEVLATLRERSTTLMPVTKNWDPDIADLLDLILQDVPYERHQLQISQFNTYRPPEVSEWYPLQNLLPSDVKDVDDTIDYYGGVYAEQLAVLLHTSVPEVMHASPKSLPLIDYHFWHFNYPGKFDRTLIETQLVPSVGAYLGEVMVRNLGGRWVPRKNLDESQVVVGDRVWLPFLRARHYLQSKESILDYSLTKFYRTAQRFT